MESLLTHWGPARQYTSMNWVIIGSGNGFSLRRRCIIWTNAKLISEEPEEPTAVVFKPYYKYHPSIKRILLTNHAMINCFATSAMETYVTKTHRFYAYELHVIGNHENDRFKFLH